MVASRREFYVVYRLTCDISESYTFLTATSWGTFHVLYPSCLMVSIQIYNSKQHHLMTHKSAVKVAAINARVHKFQVPGWLTKYFMVVSSICGYSTQCGLCFMSPL